MKRFLSGALLAAAVLSAGIALPRTAAAAAPTDFIYRKGEFDSFFQQDYELTQRNYNTFTSLAGSEIAPNDSRCFISSDVLHGSNRALKMGFAPAGSSAGTGFNTFFTLFSRPLTAISTKGGRLELSFDFYPYGWEDGSVIPLDKKLYFQVGGKSGFYFIAADKTAISEPQANSVDNLSDFPESELSGYRRVSYEIDLTKEEAAAADAVTFWFFNAFGKTCAYLDNFSVRFCGQSVLYDGSFEAFDLSAWACPSKDNQNALDNYGVSARSALPDYSPARLVDDDGNKVLRLKKGQGVAPAANGGGLVDFTLGGQKLFPSEGLYTVEMDIRREGGGEFLSPQFTLELSDFSETEAERFSNFFAYGKEYYDTLPDSAVLEGYKHIEYTFFVSADEAEFLDCLTLVFDTAEGNDTLCLDNFSIKKAERAAPAVYYVSTEKIDRGKRENLRLNTNLGDVETTLSLVFGDSIVKISPSFYKQNAGFFDIDYKLFHEYAYDGIYELYLETEGGDARVSFEVSGESGMPSTGKTEYDYFKSGDLEIDIDLKGGTLLSVKNDGIRLNADEYALSGDGGKLILRESYLKGLSAEKNEFIVAASGGECRFTVTLKEPPAEKGCNSALSGTAAGIGASAALIAAVIALKKCKNKENF